MSSRLKVYWRVWLGTVAIVFAARFFMLGGFGDPRGSKLAMVYMFVSWLSVMTLNMIESRRLMTYLKLHHYQKWDELTYIPWLGKNGTNGFRSLPWVHAPDDLGDPQLAVMKEDCRQFMRLAMTVFLSYLVIFPLLCL